MQNKRQQQVSEMIKRNFSRVLQQEGRHIYGDSMVTVTNVVMSPDMGLAKIYLSVFNSENKNAVIDEITRNYPRLKHIFGNRLRRHIRHIPHFDLYLDETLDEMYRLNDLFDRLKDENQMGKREEE